MSKMQNEGHCSKMASGRGVQWMLLRQVSVNRSGYATQHMNAHLVCLHVQKYATIHKFPLSPIKLDSRRREYRILCLFQYLGMHSNLAALCRTMCKTPRSWWRRCWRMVRLYWWTCQARETVSRQVLVVSTGVWHFQGLQPSLRECHRIDGSNTEQVPL